MADGTKSRSVKRREAEEAADRIAERYKDRDPSRLLRFLGEKAGEEQAGEQLRGAINESEMSDYAIAKLSGVAQSVISRFKSGEQGISLETFEKLCAALGLKVVLRCQSRRQRR